MTFQERLFACIELGKLLRQPSEYREAVMKRTEYHNAWFTLDNQHKALDAIAQQMLDAEQLQAWVARYRVPEQTHPQTVGLVMAGNIPLVGFHDLLTVFVAGHRAQVKLSDKDPYLLPYLLKEWRAIDERVDDYIQLVDKLQGFDAVIATGSDNSARYFEAYFGKYPHIIRRNRNGVAVLLGEETEEELRALSADILQYFGLGCRNVSKLYVPAGYEFDALLEILHEQRRIILHPKYRNNFDYHYAMLELNKQPYRNNGCLILVEDSAIASPIACLHYEPYRSLDALQQHLGECADQIQCIVAREGALDLPTLSFGQAQQPRLWDYADGVDTMAFLLKLAP